jgi:hypothetical protein
MNEQRRKGFYWVIVDGKAQVAKWIPEESGWEICGWEGLVKQATVVSDRIQAPVKSGSGQ